MKLMKNVNKESKDNNLLAGDLDSNKVKSQLTRIKAKKLTCVDCRSDK